MSVDGVLCVLEPDRGCVGEGHGGGGVPLFSAGPTCVFWVPRMGPGTSPGQPSMLRGYTWQWTNGGRAEKAPCMGKVCWQLHTEPWRWTYKMPSLADTPSVWQDIKDADPLGVNVRCLAPQVL